MWFCEWRKRSVDRHLWCCCCPGVTAVQEGDTRGSTIRDEEEWLARQEEADLQAEFALSHEEAYCSGLVVASLEAITRHVHSRLVPSPTPVDIEDDTMRPRPSSKKDPSETPVQVT
ncbi:hypothetical protein ACLOJK_007245 [Asimina triloba]